MGARRWLAGGLVLVPGWLGWLAGAGAGAGAGPWVARLGGLVRGPWSVVHGPCPKGPQPQPKPKNGGTLPFSQKSPIPPSLR